MSGKDFENGLVILYCDTLTLKSMEYLDYNHNIEYYIERLAGGTRLKEMLSDYCKPDIPSKMQKRSEVLMSIGEKTPT